MTNSEIPTCCKCGSTNVVADAFAEWDVENQDWVLRATYDYHVCDECGEENNWEMREVAA